ncbi:protein SET DOMAIN GROUP 41-like [Salvia miltiorrhiza]|uniref:protein SET DOMAIN GROUP 41-like n=1 Tax=Salvia miltiorrhiza TaxID=226208 RepID=UPI0025AC764C|nr:protein SET DOMAIN GROUP 41-like [Salvia miltiorrhiza]
MEMRAIEDIGIGQDLTPPLRPLAAVLHDAAFGTRCSACFTVLPPQPFPPSALNFPGYVPTDTRATPLYCSLACSAADSPLHFSSFEHRLIAHFATSPPSTWQSSTELRLSLRLAHVFQNLPRYMSFLGENEKPGGCLERMAGLMTNREKFVFDEIKKALIARDNKSSGKVKRITEGARMMAWARGKDVSSGRFAFEEAVLCLVMTNAVEVQEMTGFCIGIAVYDATFSWINHSCSPNCCYWFLMGPGEDEQPPLRIAPASKDGRNVSGLVMGGGISDRNGYGPRLVVRSIDAVSKGEEVTIGYLDLVQPKEMRQAELWFKYRFSCSCKRCGAVPTSYVDHALRALRTDNPKNPEHSPDEIEKLVQNLVAAISGYLVTGDAKSCCRDLEFLLYDESVELPRRVKLHPFNHLSINACLSLASAYRVRASDLLALNLELEGNHKLEALNMHKTSCAYYLLVAGIVNHFYAYEPSSVVGAANLWIEAGASLLNLAGNFLWDDDLQVESLFLVLECDGCRDVHKFERCQKRQLDKCSAKIASNVWCFLATESNFLKFIENPIDFRWLKSRAASEVSDADSGLQVEKCIHHHEIKMDLLLLSTHCSRYAAILSSICHGLPTNFRRYQH